MEHNFEEFSKLAIEKFGDKVSIAHISIVDDDLAELNKQYDIELTKKDFDDYQDVVWLVENKCPECGMDLLGLFGSFTRNSTHGIGHCGNCDKITFRYYHYIGNCKIPFRLFSVVGFS